MQSFRVVLVDFVIIKIFFFLYFLAIYASFAKKRKNTGKKNLHLNVIFKKFYSPEVFCKTGVLQNFAKFAGEHLCWSLFLNNATGLSPATLLKRTLRHGCFPANLAEFLRIHFLQNTSGRLLLTIV